MKQEIVSSSPLQIIQNDIEENSKNGKGRFALKVWEHKLDLNHERIVAIIWAIEQKRIKAGRRMFIKYESYNEKGRPCLSEIEVPKDDKIGRARTRGEGIKRKRSVESKINRYNEALKATEKDMKKINFKGKYILLSDSNNQKEG